MEAVGGRPGTLPVELDSDGVSTPGLASRYFPESLPAVAAGPGSAPSAGTILGNGLNGSPRALTSVAELPRVPGVGGPATVVDLDLLRHWGSRTSGSTRIQVWFDTEDPAELDRVRTALRGAGVEVAGVQRLSAVRAGYAASVPAWSLQLGVLAAVAGLLLAGLVLVLLVASTWRRRSRDLACLAMSGVPRRGLDRVAVGEQLPVVLIATLVGAGCGLVGAAFALPTVPLFAEPRPASALDLSVPWAGALAALAVALVGLGLVAWLCGRTVAARARLSRVREAL
jgi:predicted lysophospholipase L1 biosynthesis ABC-type transport system permease subunit